MKVSIIVPFFNELQTIREILKPIEDVPLDKEIIVVDDGSKGGTREVLHDIDCGRNVLRRASFTWTSIVGKAPRSSKA